MKIIIITDLTERRSVLMDVGQKRQWRSNLLLLVKNSIGIVIYIRSHFITDSPNLIAMIY